MTQLGHWTKREGYMPDQLESIIESPEVVLTSAREPRGGTNGMTLGLEGHLIMCEGDNRRITRREF